MRSACSKVTARASTHSFTPDGKTLISGSSDGEVKLSSYPESSEIGSIAAHKKPVSSVAVSPDGETLTTGSYDARVKLWLLPSGEEKALSKGQRTSRR